MVPGKRFFPLVAHPLCDKDSQEEYSTVLIFMMMILVTMIFVLKILILIFIFSERDPNRPPPPKTSGKLEFEYFGDRV